MASNSPPSPSLSLPRLVAIQAKVAAERQAAMANVRAPQAPVALSLPPPPGAPPPVGGGGLPPDWQQASGPQGTYYYNTRTNETSWTRPADVGGAPPPGPGYGAPPSAPPKVPKKLGITSRLGWR